MRGGGALLAAVLLLARGARAQDEDPAPSTAVSSSSDACANRGALDADSLIAGLVSDAGVSCISASIEVPFFGGVVTMSTDPIEVDMPCQGPTTVAGELAIGRQHWRLTPLVRAEWVTPLGVQPGVLPPGGVASLRVGARLRF